MGRIIQIAQFAIHLPVFIEFPAAILVTLLCLARVEAVRDSQAVCCQGVTEGLKRLYSASLPQMYREIQRIRIRLYLPCTLQVLVITIVDSTVAILLIDVIQWKLQAI